MSRSRGVNLTRAASTSGGEHGMEGRRGRDHLSSPGDAACAPAPFLDRWQLEQASTASAWVVGTGVPRVAVTSLGDSYPLAGYHDATIELQEL